MDPGLLIIILFLVAPLIERLLKANKKPPEVPPGADRPPRHARDLPGQRPGQMEDRPRVEIPRAETPRQRADDDAAAGMLPDDLWEILTGEKRAPEQRTQLPQQTRRTPTSSQTGSTEYGSVGDPPPASFEDTADHSFELDYEPEFETDFDPDFEEATLSAESVEVEPYVHEAPVRELPRVVSMEKISFDPEARHLRFHERLDELPPAARIRRRKPTRAAGMLDDDDLRRAIIMNEVLGPPKGLQ